MAEASSFPIADTITATLTQELFAGITVGEVYLFVILASVFVCTLAIQGAATRMMFSMSRDRHLPLGSIWGNVNHTFKTPANAADRRRRPRGASRSSSSDPVGGFSVSIAATGLIYLSYLLTQPRRARRALPRLAAQAGLVQPRSLGQARQHRRDPVRRR